MNPNHYLAVAIAYLYGGARPGWPAGTGDRQDARLVRRSSTGSPPRSGRRLLEVPVGFKWFVPGLLDGSVGFGGEESAGASFLRKDGTVWTTDKDGILLALLASEILATHRASPRRQHHARARRASSGSPGTPGSTRAATREQKATLAKLSPEQVTATTLAGEDDHRAG